MQWVADQCKAVDEQIIAKASEHQNSLTKPPGSLGMLEESAIRLAGMQGRLKPRLDKIAIAIFAADHGVAAEGVSAFPQAVTVEMIRNFSNGGAAISVLARQLQAALSVINMGTVTEPPVLEHVENRSAGAGTGNFCESPAMTEQQLRHCLTAGRAVLENAARDGLDLFIGGEMGIANTCSASAIGAVLLDRAPAELVGPGTGVDGKGVMHKAEVIARAIALHGDHLQSPLDVLRYLGGFEIAALVGAYIRSAQLGVPVLLDGFISTSAALLAVRINPAVADWLLLSHQSAEPAHQLMIAALKGRPLLQLDMRLGEASGAAVAVPLLRSACALHNEMASFADAGVSTAD